jgi:hypothetical protein
MFRTSFVTLALATIAGLASTVVAFKPCAESDLAGTDGSFYLPSEPGTYHPGTRQVVSWNWAIGSPVSAIVAVELTNGTDILQVEDVVGAPVIIAPLEEDQSGAIRVTLPSDLESGRYVFRVSVVSDGKICDVFTRKFKIEEQDEDYEDDEDDDEEEDEENDDDDSLSHRCELGESRCIRRSRGFVRCVETRRGRRFRQFHECPENQICEQIGDRAYCFTRFGEGRRDDDDEDVTPETCTEYAKYECDEDGFRVCVRDIDGNLVYSDTVSCAEGQTCQEIGTSVTCVDK